MVTENWFMDFPLRGNRDYLHSTSVCNHLFKRLGCNQKISITFKTWMNSRVYFSFDDTLCVPVKGNAVITGIDGTKRVLVFGDDGKHIATERVPYDEDGIVETAQFKGEEITIHSHPHATFTDRAIAANKKLIHTILNPGVELIASKITLIGAPPDGPFTLRIQSHVGKRIFKSALLIDGSPFGEIIFYGE